MANVLLLTTFQIIEDDTHFYLLFDDEGSVRGARQHFEGKEVAGHKLPVQSMNRPWQTVVDAMPDDTEEADNSRASGEDHLRDSHEPPHGRTCSPARSIANGEGRRWYGNEADRYPDERDSRQHNGYTRESHDREEQSRYHNSTVQIYDYRDQDPNSRARQPRKGDPWRPDDEERDARRHASRDRSEGTLSRSYQAKELDDNGWESYDAIDKRRKQEQVHRDWESGRKAEKKASDRLKAIERAQQQAEKEAERERRRDAKRPRTQAERQAAVDAAIIEGPTTGSGWGQSQGSTRMPPAPAVAQHTKEAPAAPPATPAHTLHLNGYAPPTAAIPARKAPAGSSQLPSFRPKPARLAQDIKADEAYPVQFAAEALQSSADTLASPRKDSPVRRAREKSAMDGQSGSDATAYIRDQSRKKQRRSQPATSLTEASESDEDRVSAAMPARRFSAKPKKTKRNPPLPAKPAITWTSSEEEKEEKEEKEVKQGNGEDRIRTSSVEDASDSELEKAEKARKGTELAAAHPALLQGVDIVLPAADEVAQTPSAKAETAADEEAPPSSPLSSPPADIIPLHITHHAETDAINVVELVLPAPERLPSPSMHADMPKRGLEEIDAVAPDSDLPLPKRARLLSPALPFPTEAGPMLDDAAPARLADTVSTEEAALEADAVEGTLAEDLMAAPAVEHHGGIANAEDVAEAVADAASAPALEPAKKKSRARAPAKGSKKGSKKGRKGAAAATAVPIVAQPPITRPSELGITESEDAYYLKLALSRLRQGHALLPPEQPVPHEDTAEARHEKGCARAEGFYRIPQLEKLSYLASRNQARVGETAGASTSASAIAVSRLARANARQFASGLDKHKKATASDTDLLQFNQLKSRKKQMRFARSPIHDWGLYALEHIPAGEMVIEYVGESIRQQVADHREKAYERMGIGSSYLLWVVFLLRWR